MQRQAVVCLGKDLRTLEFISSDLMSLGPTIFVCKLARRTSPIRVCRFTPVIPELGRRIARLAWATE